MALPSTSRNLSTMMCPGMLVLAVFAVATADRVTMCPDFCLNGGSCVISDLGFRHCLCPHGWMGHHCETQVSTACASSPCQNGYTCTPKGLDDYDCGCDVTFGKNCHLATRGLYYNCYSSNTVCAVDETCIMQEVVCKTWPCYDQVLCVKKSRDICKLYKPCRYGGTCGVTSDGDFQCECKDFASIGRQCEQVII